MLIFLNCWYLYQLDTYTICEKLYNQFIAINKFYQHLIGSNQGNERSRLDSDERIRVRLSDTTIELEQTRTLLKLSRLESQQKSQSITDLNNQITQMRQQLESQIIEINSPRIWLLFEIYMKKNMKEWRSSTNTIDSFVTSIETDITHMKECPSCNKKQTANRKQVCPTTTCGMRLPTFDWPKFKRNKQLKTNLTQWNNDH